MEAAARFQRTAGQASRRLNRQELAWLAILHGWPRLLQSELQRNPSVHVLDQGPVYLMSELRESGPTYLRDRSAEQSWQALYAGWARLLDAVVYLDAPDAVLTERIRARGKTHIMKHEPDETIGKFLHAFRATYSCILSALSAQNSALHVISFDTSRQSPEQITGALVSAFRLTA
jgi:hypothetical protein